MYVMAIPKFNKMGLLDKGIHQCTAEEFIERFCYGENTIRRKYKEVLEQMFAFSVRYGVKSIIVAGSFVSDKEKPNDLDCIAIFPNEKCIPMKTDEMLVVEECEFDIMFAAENNKELIYSMINMFAINRFEISVGMVEIILDDEKDKSTWQDYENYNSVEALLKAREAYIFRSVIRGTPKKKLLVTVCNMEEYLLWNYNIAHIASSAGWIFAPYIYNSKEVENYVDAFKTWLRQIYYTYETDVSVFADGLGTYLLGRYLKDDNPYRRVIFDKIILSRALLNSDFNWEREFKSNIIKLVINMKDKTDISKVSEKIPNDVKRNKLYGEAYKIGFNNKYDKLIEYRYNYNKEIRSDEFKNNIFPMFHISGMMVENNSKSLNDTLDSIFNKKVKVSDVIIKK